MSFVDDSVGKRFGRLVVTNVVTGHRRRLANCKCDCGNEKVVDPRMLKRGDTTSCGCFHKEMVSALRSPDLTGQRFYMLTVMERGSKKTVGTAEREEHTWKCACDCGQQIIVTTNSLNTGNVRSCGCLRTVAAKARQQQRYASVVNALKFKAVQRGYAWELSQETAEALLQGHCSYCGQPPAQRGTALPRNGIDRVDNRIGYIDTNCVTACKLCNQMKHTLSVEDFKRHAQRIANYKESA